MAQSKTTRKFKVAEMIEQYGRCLELIPMDPHFHDITVGLYVKDGIATVWTYSQKSGVDERIRHIRAQLIALGGLLPVEETYNQAKFPCDYLHVRPVKFLLMQAVEKDPNYAHPEGAISIKDTKSPLMLSVTPREADGKWVYEVSGEGEAPNKPMRLRAVVAGFIRYGEMEKASDTAVIFPCGYRHDELARLVMPYSRNISVVEDMLEASAMRGQMTTQTLGFSQT